MTLCYTAIGQEMYLEIEIERILPVTSLIFLGGLSNIYNTNRCTRGNGNKEDPFVCRSLHPEHSEKPEHQMLHEYWSLGKFQNPWVQPATHKKAPLAQPQGSVCLTQKRTVFPSGWLSLGFSITLSIAPASLPCPPPEVVHLREVIFLTSFCFLLSPFLIWSLSSTKSFLCISEIDPRNPKTPKSSDVQVSWCKTALCLHVAYMCHVFTHGWLNPMMWGLQVQWRLSAFCFLSRLCNSSPLISLSHHCFQLCYF